MDYMFQTPSGLVVERATRILDYRVGIEHLIESLDNVRGAFLSSNVEDPDRYARWDMAVIEPPIEFVGLGRRLEVNALNQRGERLLAMLRPRLSDGVEVVEVSAEDRRLVLEVAAVERFFAEEERSLQPSLFTPLRRLIADFAGIADGFLGLYGAFGYDLIFQFEHMPLTLDRSRHEKDLHLFLADRIYVVDRRKEVALRYDFEFSAGPLTTSEAAREAYRPVAAAPGGATGRIESDHEAEEYAAKVDYAKARMHAGDVFEVVLSRSFRAAYGSRPSQLYRDMRALNPSPYEFFCQLGDEQLIGTSPEMFVRVEGRRVESSPIAGTIRRGENPMEDAEQLRALYNSDKDEVELTMCTDVDRNDKARICEPGSVRLLARRMIERYAGLFHTVDHVEGRLRPEFGGIDAFLSHMWAVTLTGAPKRNAVRIIEEQEKSPRGWYGGAVGAFLLNGNVNTGITIRTVHLKAGVAGYRSGASLVYDSDGAAEELETRTKATTFFKVLGQAPAKAPAATRRETVSVGAGRKVVMIDNEDSFVHTLADYFRQTGAEVTTYRWGVPVAQILALGADLVVHSPGPGRPAEFGVPALVRELAGHGLPQFGVCLGLQGIAEAFGGSLEVLEVPRHGKVWEVHHQGTGLFQGLPEPCRVGAYHSLIARRFDLPADLEVSAWTEAGLVMALAHRELPVAAVQFHPESILSLTGGLGHALIANAIATLALGGPRRQAAGA